MAVMEREGPVPYREYPRMLYKLDGATCLVQTDKERDAKLAEGWTLSPDALIHPPFSTQADTPVEPVPANTAASGAPGDAEVAAGTPEPVESDETPHAKKRGRPKKAQS